MRPFAFDPGDLAPGDDVARAVSALGSVRLEEVTGDTADRAAFREAYAALHAFFGAANEIEREEVLERWLFAPDPASPVRYHLLVARAEDGALAAVRDGFTAVLSPAAGAGHRVVALMSHTWVAPPWRRTGLAAVLRAAPAAFARDDARRAGVPDAERLLVAEMEFVDPAVPDTLVRLVAYGRAGFRVVPPALVPYAQPDFRDLGRDPGSARPVPLLLLVRQPDADDRRDLSRDRLAALFDGLDAIHGPAVQGDQLVRIRAWALGASAVDPVPLWSPPDRADDDAPFAPLLRSEATRRYPPGWA